MPEEEFVHKSKSGALVWILVIILLLAIGAGAYYLIGNRPKEKATNNDNSGGGAVAVAEDWSLGSDVVRANTTSTDTHRLAPNLYRMYFMDQGGIFYSDSTDCQTFAKAQPTGVTEDRGMMISNPAVLSITPNEWIMIYEMAPAKQPGQKNGQPSAANQRNLYLATSTDGKTFSKAGIAIDSSVDDNYFASVPDLVLLPDNSVQMFYVSGGEAIATAISIDGGKSWNRQGYALKNMAVDPDVIYRKSATEEKWVMYYSNLDPKKNAIYKATSTDGIKWENETKLFGPTTGGAVVDPDVVEISSSSYVMFFGQSSGGGSTGGETISLYRATLDKSIY